jgi:hypothetical protein
MRALLLALCLLSGSAWADKLFTDGPLSIRFHETACVVPLAAATLAGQTRSTPHALTITLKGRSMRGCWALDNDKDYIVVDEQGGGGSIYARAVKDIRSL